MMDIRGRWQCHARKAPRCWPTRRRFYRCDTPRDFHSGVTPAGLSGRLSQASRGTGPPTRSPGPKPSPPRNGGAQGGLPLGAGVGCGASIWGRITKLEFNLQQHVDMLQEVLLQSQTVGDEVRDLRALVVNGDALDEVVPVVAASVILSNLTRVHQTPLTRCAK